MLLLLFVLLFITLTKVCSQTEVYTTPDTSEEGLLFIIIKFHILIYLYYNKNYLFIFSKVWYICY